MSQTKAKIKLPKDIFKKYPSEVILEASKIIDKYVLEKSKTMSDKKRDLANFKTFVNTYFSHYLTVPFGKIQNEIISDIEKTVYLFVNPLRLQEVTQNRLSLLLWALFGLYLTKSTFLS